MTGWVVGLIVLVIVVAIVWFVMAGFNRLRRADIGTQEALGGIDVQLTRRADLIPNLVETVKGYASHERGVFDEVTQARAGVTRAAKDGSVPEKAQAQAALDKAIVNVLAVAENYPELKASANFMQLQEQLGSTEDQLAFARQYYNDKTRALNELVMTIPWMLLTGVANVHQREFYEAPEGQEAPPQVRF